VIVYSFKSSPYSSHFLVPACLPPDGRGRRVLDLGCSDGFLSELLARRGYEVVGVERAGGHSSSFPANVQLIEADLDRGLPPAPGRFDYVLCADILEHLRSPETLLRQIRGVLAPGGRIVASLPNSGNLYFRLVVLSGRFPRRDRGLFDRTHVCFFTFDGWVGAFAAAGFRFESVRPSAIPFSVVLPHFAESFAVGVLERLSYVMARLWKRLFAYQFVIIACPAQEQNEH
jgi:SAM-dependent methyltransferase